MMSLLRALAVLLLALVPVMAQGQSWQQVYDDVMMVGEDEEDAESLADSYELLEQLASHPLELNSCTREELEQLPFLSEQQVMDLQEYLHRYGPMRSLGELRMVRSLDYQQLALLPFFVYIDNSNTTIAPAPYTIRIDSLLHHAHHTLTTTVRVPFYRRQGDRNGYLGYRYRHSLRYELNSDNHLRAGIIGAQDAGEPFFAQKNRWGYDYYSYYLQLKKVGRLDNLVMGKYKLAAGMGLVLGQSFQLGKLATLQSLGRSVQAIRPHSSRAESDYFLGASATVSLLRPVAGHQLLLSAFASRRPVDATLTTSGDAQTLITSGYHRTPTEMAKKNNTHIAAGGARLAYRQGALQLGLTAVTSTLDRELQPQRNVLFRQHYAHGRHFTNVGADYRFMHHRLALSGETAIDGHGALATVNALSLQPSARLSLLALQRFYSFRYTTLYGHSFSEGGRTQNESGFYLGATWNPLAHLTLQGYADYAYFPWARYQVSQSSHDTDLLLQATYRRRRWTLMARHRSHLRQKDNETKTALVANNDHRERLALSYDLGQLTLKTQADMSHTNYKQNDNGWMLSQQLTWMPGLQQGRQPLPDKGVKRFSHLQLNALVAYFDTDSYQSRIYVYERQLQHEFYFPTYYGRGMRLAMSSRVDVGSRFRLALRIGHTKYFDRQSIGSALQQINHSYQTDLDLQLRVKL